MPAKSHNPTDETRAAVSALASFGFPQEDIAKYIGISKPTLAKHYGEELKLSAINSSREVGEFLHFMASGRALQKGATYGECSRAAMFWAKTRMGWRETERIDHTSSDGSMTTRGLTDAVESALRAKHGKPDA